MEKVGQLVARVLLGHIFLLAGFSKIVANDNAGPFRSCDN